MEKLLTVVLVSSLLLVATLAVDASSRSSLHAFSLYSQRGHVLGRKGREEVVLPGYNNHHHQRKGEHEVTAMEVKRDAERKGGWREDEDEDAGAATAEGPLIYSADYSGVAMHDRGSSPPAHKNKMHPRP